MFCSVNEQQAEKIKDKLERVKAEMVFEIIDGWQFNKKVYNDITEEYEQKEIYAIIVKPQALRVWSVIEKNLLSRDVTEPLFVVKIK